ncbi:MAG: NAD(P)-binding protein [bacterium]
MENRKILIIGSGPAGLTAGFEFLKKEKYQITILEQDSVVGGLAKTIDFKGCKFDIGPHHYVTDSEKIEAWWKKLMEKDFLPLKRFTRIYYKKHFFKYPLEVFNVLRGLSLLECFKSVFSYIKIRLFPIKKVKSFEDWVTNRFGKRLYSIFFKTYTEKVWGIKCTEISSDWASERIQSFSLGKAIFYAFFGCAFRNKRPRTIKDDFYYPVLGSGTLWQKVADQIITNEKGEIFLNEKVIEIEHVNFEIKSVLTKKSEEIKKYDVQYFASSMPLQELILSLKPIAPQAIIEAANKLKYRALITANFIINKKNICPDHWLYIHEKELKMGRIGNMNNFSKKLLDDQNHTALSLEYFTFVDDEFWNKNDVEILDLAKNEILKMNFAKENEILDGFVLRSANAYPVYDKNYKKSLNALLKYLEQFENLHLMGRNGMHKYNNMDVAMLSAFNVVNKIEKQELLKRKKDKIESVKNLEILVKQKELF